VNITVVLRHRKTIRYKTFQRIIPNLFINNLYYRLNRYVGFRFTCPRHSRDRTLCLPSFEADLINQAPIKIGHYEWSPTHGFTGVVPFIRDSLPAMPGVRRGRRASQPVLEDAQASLRMRSMGQLFPAYRENPGTRKPIHPWESPESSGHRDKTKAFKNYSYFIRCHILSVSGALKKIYMRSESSLRLNR
jgi:hypothetical protein